MASCGQIEAMFQAYVDGELAHSDSVILKQHMAGCPPCAGRLRDHERVCACLYETLKENRLRRDLVPGIMEHLPEMERDGLDVETVNWRVKHAFDRWTLLTRLAPVAVGGVLFLVAVTLLALWPRGSDTGAAIGVVTQQSGEATVYAADAATPGGLAIRDFIFPGQRFETGPNEKLMLTILGPTQIKLNENSSLLVRDQRTLELTQGQMLARVAEDNRVFRVFMPVGGVTVTGTVFDIALGRSKATVTVAEGSVQVDNDVAFGRVEPGQQVDLAIGAQLLEARPVNVASVSAWADLIQPDPKAALLFQERIEPKGDTRTLASYQVGIVTDAVQNRSVKGVFIEWEPDALLSGHCGYDVFVFERKKPLFKGHVGGSIFDDKKMRSYTISVPGNPIRNVKRLDIKIVPDRSEGSVETEFAEISAIGLSDTPVE